MAIQTNITTITDNITEVGHLFYEIKEFLVSVGWTVAGSSDGSAGGMDAVDRIVNGAAIDDSDTWVVLQSPHAVAGDRVQILFSKAGSTATEGQISYNPNADYAGATTAVPTSSYDTLVLSTTLYTDDQNNRVHMLAEDSAPYGFAVLVTAQGAPSTEDFALALVPLATSAPVDPGKPYALFAAGSAHSGFSAAALNDLDLTVTVAHMVAEGDAPPTAPSAAAAAFIVVDGNTVVPNGTPLSSDGKDQSSPCIIQSTTEFFGVSTFMRWNGVPRSNLDTLQDGVSVRGRIVFGDVNFPWDGTTVPLA